MRRPPVVVVGDCLLDVDVDGTVERLSPDAPAPVFDERTTRMRPGGAGLAAVLAARDGVPVTLIAALADDPAGHELRHALDRAGVEVVALELDGATPEKVRLRSGERTLVRLDRGAGRAAAGSELPAAARAALEWAGATLVADYGRGITAHAGLRVALARRADGTPLVWDPHPRGAEPPPGVTVVTPNVAEAAVFDGPSRAGCAQRATALAGRWDAEYVCITRGERGAILGGAGGETWALPSVPVSGGDPCGAGDRFAARLATALAAGAAVPDAVRDAVRAASEFVADGGAGTVGLARTTAAIPCSRPDADGVVQRVRSAGGTVVATGGCFDLLHAGHLLLLESARALGDALVVCLNDDASVRRLKGAGRPIVAARERAELLSALRCVDAVVVFGEDDPCAALEQLRPDVWVKGGDYGVAELPEAAVVRRWGGEVVLMPYLDGRSTTQLLEEASLRAIH